ncbi:hypothetical protein HK105_201868 [Polyrhizophydium stewartii]|uniref:Programmed cell death protein 5 n=1 Tax=Polyrhizophydium stewartii TaxID=2732419 RepID=A0ABR4NG17_9FUNG
MSAFGGDELQAIRARRMAELRRQDVHAKKPDPEEMRRNMLFQILDNSARERLARIKIVKSDKARAVEDMLLRMAQSGQLRGKVNESQLIEFLEQISEQSQQSTKITVRCRVLRVWLLFALHADAGLGNVALQFNRRRIDDDDDDDDDEWDL